MVSDQVAGLLVSGATMAGGAAVVGVVSYAFRKQIRAAEVRYGWPDYSRGWYGVLFGVGLLGVLLVMTGLILALTT